MSGVLVVMEQNAGAWHRMSWETLAAGQQLAAQLGQTVSRCCRWAGGGTRRQEARPRLYHRARTSRELHRRRLHGSAGATDPQDRARPFVLFPHTYQVRDFAPKLATRFDKVLISDAIGLRVESGARRLRSPAFPRQVERGRETRWRRAAFRLDPGRSISRRPSGGGYIGCSGAVCTLNSGRHQIRAKPLEPFRESARAVDLTSAEIIVSVGRGIKEKDNIPIVEELGKSARRRTCGIAPDLRQRMAPHGAPGRQLRPDGLAQDVSGRGNLRRDSAPGGHERRENHRGHQ